MKEPVDATGLFGHMFVSVGVAGRAHAGLRAWPGLFLTTCPSVGLLLLCLLSALPAGCGMFDESAAVPAAPEYHLYEDESQPLGPYSCTLEEAGGCRLGS